ncbi:MAG: HD domain-containing protein [Myxococcota bacterium]
MEVRDPLHGSISVNDGERKVIDTPLFQRLRQIKQMGFADLAFPGATHSRYIHSIGAMHLAERAFDRIFEPHRFERPGLAATFRQLVRLGALLHDIGHAPLSHCTEFAMPSVEALQIPVYRGVPNSEGRRATHEDYTIKILTDSPLTRVLEEQFPHIRPLHVAALVNQSLPVDDDFFLDGGIHYRTVLAQIISSELDVDRMDYLQRDSYYAGVSYGTYDVDWLLTNLTFHVHEQRAHLGLDPRAIYAFNDFLISRYHMFLMVYFHHKSVVYEEMLRRYFQSADASYSIPADIEAYTDVDDAQLSHHLRQAARRGQPWAQRISMHDPYRVALELHGQLDEHNMKPMQEALEGEQIPFFVASSTGNLSKYTRVGEKRRQGAAIYVVPRASGHVISTRGVQPLEEYTDLFSRYEQQRQLSRIYVPGEQLKAARGLLERLARQYEQLVLPLSGRARATT